jgi:fatty acid-binding protein DegV
MSAEDSDPVNHPAHYAQSGLEPITAIDAWELGFSLGCAVKYIARAEHKGTPLEDLKKARWYLDHEIERREAQEAAR